jgi:hypothetical protein
VVNYYTQSLLENARIIHHMWPRELYFSVLSSHSLILSFNTICSELHIMSLNKLKTYIIRWYIISNQPNIHIVIIVLVTLYSLVLGTNVSEEYTATIFMVEVNKLRKMVGGMNRL